MGTFRLFFGWPAGGTWSNMVASVEWAAVALLTVYLFRNKIGPRLAAWWKRHNDIHEHVSAEIEGLRQDLTRQLAEHQRQNREHIDRALSSAPVPGDGAGHGPPDG